MKRASTSLKMIATVASLVRASTRPGAPSLAERASAVPRLVRATVDGSYSGTTPKRLALAAAAVVYVVSPIDLVPELLLPVLGAADDAVVIGWAIKAFVEETDRYLTWELGQGLSPQPRTVPGHVVRVDPTRDPTRDTSGAAAEGRRGGSSASVRENATDYLLEAMRKRLER